jgi:amino acid transporter
MAREGLLPAALAHVDSRRRTPSVAVATAFALALGVVVSGGVRALAQGTSLILLAVFATLHLALLVLKWREPAVPADAFQVPSLLPAAGLVSCVGLAFHFPAETYMRLAAVVGVALVLYGLFRHRVSAAGREV